MADLSPGSTWASFRIERLVGRGPAGTVYRALSGDKPVALKILHESLGEAVLARFEDDTRRLVGLSHPNILRVESVGREGGRRFFVTEAFDGRPLPEVGPRPLREACEIFLKAARALGAAWMRLVLHRNLQPRNLLISATGEVKVTDFGLFQEPTPYWSPERRSGQSADMRSDLYSLGTIFREFLAQNHGRSEFEAECLLFQPIVEGAGIIYVVDGSEPLLEIHAAEMEILRLTGQPRLAIIN